MNTPSKSLYLIDGTAYVYRAFHSTDLSTSSGEPTGAVYGVGNMLRRVIREHEPDYLVAVFDAKGKTFRHDLYEEYKANRPPMPDDLRSQYDLIKEMVVAMGIKSISIPGVEADDVIGTLATAACEAGLTTYISSSDKDLTQLVNERVTVIDDMRGTELGPSQVKEKFGVRPDQIIDYLSLVGDTSDNIPGVPLVGPKTAAKWLSAHDSVDNIINISNTLPGKAGENFRNAIPQLQMSKDLVSLKLDVDVELDLEDFKIAPPKA
ncbi:MAG: DNA polymerase I, partial [Gammaproteobacteria bacterium]|nr:DNA polymerase I [Gammaproteobacteria bacterium]